MNLYEAAENGRLDGLRATLLRGSAQTQAKRTNSLGQTILHLAARGGHDDCVRFLVGVELAQNAPPIDAQDYGNGWTALHYAILHRHLTVAAILIDAGANMQIADKQGLTPLDLISFRAERSKAETFTEIKPEVEIVRKQQPPDEFGIFFQDEAEEEWAQSRPKIKLETNAAGKLHSWWGFQSDFTEGGHPVPF